MEFLAIIVLVLTVTNIITPGSQFKEKPVLDYESPKLYINIASFFFTMALVAVVLL